MVVFVCFVVFVLLVCFRLILFNFVLFALVGLLASVSTCCSQVCGGCLLVLVLAGGKQFQWAAAAFINFLPASNVNHVNCRSRFMQQSTETSCTLIIQ